jgi:hypothetical protein
MCDRIYHHAVDHLELISVLGVYTRLHSVYVNVYIHYFIFKVFHISM